jgi:hypothetical protein
VGDRCIAIPVSIGVDEASTLSAVVDEAVAVVVLVVAGLVGRGVNAGIGVVAVSGFRGGTLRRLARDDWVVCHAVSVTIFIHIKS